MQCSVFAVGRCMSGRLGGLADVAAGGRTGVVKGACLARPGLQPGGYPPPLGCACACFCLAALCVSSGVTTGGGFRIRRIPFGAWSGCRSASLGLWCLALFPGEGLQWRAIALPSGPFRPCAHFGTMHLWCRFLPGLCSMGLVKGGLSRFCGLPSARRSGFCSRAAWLAMHLCMEAATPKWNEVRLRTLCLRHKHVQAVTSRLPWRNPSASRITAV